MINFFLVSFLFFISNTYASECFQYEIKGVVRIHKDTMLLIVHENTASEFKLEIKVDDFKTFAPFLNVTTLGNYLFKNKPGKTEKIESVIDVKSSLPDPLNPPKHSFLKEKQKVKCS